MRMVIDKYEENKNRSYPENADRNHVFMRLPIKKDPVKSIHEIL
jgi:hypothetical protein